MSLRGRHKREVPAACLAKYTCARSSSGSGCELERGIASDNLHPAGLSVVPLYQPRTLRACANLVLEPCQHRGQYLVDDIASDLGVDPLE